MLRMQQVREQKGWTKAELSRQAVIGETTLGQFESGRLKPYDSQLIKVAKALEWDGDPKDLMDEV